MKTPQEPEGRSTTRELLRAAERGQEEAWKALYLRYRKVLRAMLQRSMPRQSRGQRDTDDVLQSTFLTAWKALDEFEYRGPDSFRRWLATILKHKVVDHARGEERQRRKLAGFQAQIGSSVLDESPSAAIVRDELQQRVLEELACLSVEDQELIGQRFFDHLSWPEIAARHQVAESTARRRMLDALERLMQRVV